MHQAQSSAWTNRDSQSASGTSPPRGSTTTRPLPGTLASDHHHRHPTGLPAHPPPPPNRRVPSREPRGGWRPLLSSPPHLFRTSRRRRCSFVCFGRPARSSLSPCRGRPPSPSRCASCGLLLGAGSSSLTDSPCVRKVCEGVRAIMSGPATPARLRLMSDLKAMMQEPPEVRWCLMTLFFLWACALSPLRKSVPLAYAVWLVWAPCV